MQLTPTSLQGLREIMGLTRDEMAARLHCSQEAIIKWEKGERGIPENLPMEIQDIKARFDELVDKLRAMPDPTLPTHGEQDGWPARSWRHAAILAGRYDTTPDTMSYIEAKAQQVWRKMQGEPGAWRGLADWGAENQGDDKLAVLITQSGMIVGEARRCYETSGTIYRATEETCDRWGCLATPADMVAAAIQRQTGERVAMVTVEDVTRGKL